MSLVAQIFGFIVCVLGVYGGVLYLLRKPLKEFWIGLYKEQGEQLTEIASTIKVLDARVGRIETAIGMHKGVDGGAQCSQP